MRFLVVLPLLAACAGGNPARDAVDARKAADAVPVATPAGEAWTCPMHPEVVADHPEKCPKCGMDLVKKVD